MDLGSLKSAVYRTLVTRADRQDELGRPCDHPCRHRSELRPRSRSHRWWCGAPLSDIGSAQKWSRCRGKAIILRQFHMPSATVWPQSTPCAIESLLSAFESKAIDANEMARR